MLLSPTRSVFAHPHLDQKSALITSLVVTLLCASILLASTPSFLTRPQVSLVETFGQSTIRHATITQVGATTALLTFEKLTPSTTTLRYGQSPTTRSRVNTLPDPHWEFTDLSPDTYYYFTLDDSPIYSFKTQK